MFTLIPGIPAHRTPLRARGLALIAAACPTVSPTITRENERDALRALNARVPGYLSAARRLGDENEALRAQLWALGAGGARGGGGSPGSSCTEAALWVTFESAGRAVGDVERLWMTLGDVRAAGNELVARCEFAAGVGHQLSSDIERMVQDLYEVGFVRQALQERLQTRAVSLRELDARSQEMERSLKLARVPPGLPAAPSGLQVLQGPEGPSLPEALAALRAQYSEVTARLQGEVREMFCSQLDPSMGAEASVPAAGTSSEEMESRRMEESVAELSAQLKVEQSRRQQLRRALEEAEGGARGALEALRAHAGTLLEEMEQARARLARQAAARGDMMEEREALWAEIVAYRVLVEEAGGDGDHSRGIAVSAKGRAVLPTRSTRARAVVGVPVRGSGPPLRVAAAAAPSRAEVQHEASGGDIARVHNEMEEEGAMGRPSLQAEPVKEAFGDEKVFSVRPQEVREEVSQEGKVICEEAQKVATEELPKVSGQKIQVNGELQKSSGAEIQVNGEELQKSNSQELQSKSEELQVSSEEPQKFNVEELQAQSEESEQVNSEEPQKVNVEELHVNSEELLVNSEDLRVQSEELPNVTGEALQGQVNSEAAGDQVNGEEPADVIDAHAQSGGEVSGERPQEVRLEIHEDRSQADEAVGDVEPDGTVVLGDEPQATGEEPLTDTGPTGDTEPRADPEPEPAEGSDLPGPLEEEKEEVQEGSAEPEGPGHQ